MPCTGSGVPPAGTRWSESLGREVAAGDPDPGPGGGWPRAEAWLEQCGRPLLPEMEDGGQCGRGRGSVGPGATPMVAPPRDRHRRGKPPERPASPHARVRPGLPPGRTDVIWTLRSSCS